MLIFDNRTSGAELVEDHFVYNSSIENDQIVFNATYYVNSDIVCPGKISGMFDLFVLGDIIAKEIDIKGRLVCLGECDITETAIVQNGIWAMNITAGKVQSNENIYAQEMNVGTVKCGGKIIVEKTLTISEFAEAGGNVLCGETVYGSGKIVAKAVITGEPIDLDDGERSVVSQYSHTDQNLNIDVVTKYSEKFRERGDYVTFLRTIINEGNDTQKKKAGQYLEKMNRISSIVQKGLANIRDTKVLLDMISIKSSDWFSDWSAINDLTEKLLSHFESLLRKEKNGSGFSADDNLTCELSGYRDWLQSLEILYDAVSIFSDKLYNSIYVLLMTNLGLKPKFVLDRFKEKGWSINGK